MVRLQIAPVRVGDVYFDMDPRDVGCQYRTVKVLELRLVPSGDQSNDISRAICKSSRGSRSRRSRTVSIKLNRLRNRRKYRLARRGRA